jgi:hypothetical protein
MSAQGFDAANSRLGFTSAPLVLQNYHLTEILKTGRVTP